MSEWLKEHAWKACIRGNADRGFESLSLRSLNQSKFQSLKSPVGLWTLDFGFSTYVHEGDTDENFIGGRESRCIGDNW